MRFTGFIIPIILGLTLSTCKTQTMKITCCNSEYEIITQNYNASNSFEIWIPQAFTPNGDGLNDVFRIYVSEGGRVETLEIKKGLRSVYNSNSFFEAFWGGDGEKDGKFRYTAEIRTDMGDIIEIKGNVCLMRLETADLDLLESQEDKICECVMPDMIDARRGIIYNSEECPTN